MELGATICTTASPQCPDCPVGKFCVAFRENRVADLPNPGKRAPATARHFVAMVAERNGHFLVRQRPAGVVNAHLWEFPNLEIAPGQGSSGRESAQCSSKKSRSRLTSAATNGLPEPGIARAAKNLGFELSDTKPFYTIKHSITRYRITLEAFRVQLKQSPPKLAGVWRTPAQMERLAFTAAHKKLVGIAIDRVLSNSAALRPGA